MVTLSEWFGRFGNNIQQISNAIYYCKKNKLNFYSPKHPLVQEFKIEYGENLRYSNRFFFYDGRYKDFDCIIEELNNSRRDLCLKYIVPNFRFSVDSPYDDKTLIIHIRSGDVFRHNPPNTYTPNPLSFYEKIIEKYEEVIVVSEDYDNPVLKELSKNPKVLIQATTLENDFATLLRAKNLVTSGVVTFAMAAAICSKNLQNLYFTNLYLTEHLNPTMLKSSNINLCLTELQDYIKIGEWNNSESQRQILLGYKVKC